MQKLLKAFLKTGSGSVIAIIFGVVTTKILAVFSGPAGVGLFSLLRQFQQTLVGLASMQGNTALVQGLSSRGESQKERYLVTVATIILTASIVVCIIVWILAPILARSILYRSDNETIWIIRGLIPSILCAVGVAYLGGLLNGYRAIGRLALVQVLSAIFTAILTYPLVIFFGNPWGLLLVLWVTSFTGFLVSLIFTWRSGWLLPLTKNWLHLWDRDSALYFIKFAGISILTGVIGTGTVLLVRLLFVHYGGLAEAGIFDVAWTLSSTYLMILLGALGTYYMPVLSATKNFEERAMLIVQVFRLMVLLAVPIIILIILCKPLIINLLYTEEFIPALAIIQWMLIGDYFKAISWVLAIPMQAFADLKVFFWSELLWNLGMLIGGWLALFVFGKTWLVGVVFLLLYLIYMCFCYIYAKNKHGLKLKKNELRLWLTGLALIITTSALTWNEQYVDWGKIGLLGIVVPIFLWFGIPKKERDVFILYFRRGKGYERT